jgi:tRNA pseudouridine32 synthase/23S rRNA pseudouridine746 synthase
MGPGPISELDQLSRADAAEKRRMRARHAAEREPLARAVAAIDARRRALQDERAAKSRRYLHALFDTYEIANARGERAGLRALFAPDEPPGGSGDCAAPKLLGHAYREGLRPLALAEFWWGAPPATGGRHHGMFYPACRGKCGPVLAHMLEGLDAEPAPVFASRVDADAPRVAFEDAWLAIVEKPAGLLAVPGRGEALRDSVQTRLAARHGEAFVVHRLDLDVSGLMIVAKDRATYVALQRLFAERAIAKRYVAWVDGVVAGEQGSVDLPLRVDLDDRPRQIVDPVHGRPALTEWRVVERSSDLTKVELIPHTGRAHQLRVHAAHPLGIGAAIVGDALYGREAARLHLHGAHVAFVHPHTKERVEVNWLPPF